MVTVGHTVSPTEVPLFGSPSEVHSHAAACRLSTIGNSLESGDDLLLFFVIGFGMLYYTPK